MTKTSVEVITSVQRRRRWSRMEKERIVAAALEAGAKVSEVARAAGIHTSQLFRWRQQLCELKPSAPTFSAVTVAAQDGPAPPLPLPVPPTVVEIEFASGARMRMTGPVEASALSALIVALAKRRP